MGDGERLADCTVFRGQRDQHQASPRRGIHAFERAVELLRSRDLNRQIAKRIAEACARQEWIGLPTFDPSHVATQHVQHGFER